MGMTRSVTIYLTQVRDSKVSFTPDAALGMLVRLHKGKKGGSDDSKERVQSMQSYGMEDWKDWKSYIAPEDCLMKHRTSDMYASKHYILDKGKLWVYLNFPCKDCLTILTFCFLTDAAPTLVDSNNKGTVLHVIKVTTRVPEICHAAKSSWSIRRLVSNRHCLACVTQTACSKSCKPPKSYVYIFRDTHVSETYKPDYGTGCELACFAGQTSAGLSGKQSREAVHADIKAEGVNAAKCKRNASAHDDDAQVQGLWCMIEQLEVAVLSR